MTRRELFDRWCSNGGVRKSCERHRLRRMTLYRARGRCRWCGRHLTLRESQLHHELPYAYGDPRGSVALHRDCHWAVHLLQHHLRLLYQTGDRHANARAGVRRRLRPRLARFTRPPPLRTP